MEHQLNIHEAKTQMSKLVELVREKGEEFVIAKSGKPVARIVPLAPAKRRLGLLDGKIRIPENFNEPLPEEVVGAFEGQS